MKNTEHKQILPAAGIVSKIANENVPSKDTADNFPIVGIGASAGGLEAMELFFKNMPPNPGMAFVVVQHLDPTHVGILPELLKRNTAMVVLQVTDRLKVLPDHIYVIPPNKSLTILNGVLHLSDLIQNRLLRLPIDIFFRSLALDKLNKSAGVILSGMGSDGSLGIKTIKEHRGFVLVQDPATAKFDSMPRYAIEAILVDIVAPVEELPAKLITLFKHRVVIANESIIDTKKGLVSTKLLSYYEKRRIMIFYCTKKRL